MSTVASRAFDAPALAPYGLPSLERGANPAANTDFSARVPGEHFTRLISVFCRLVTDSNAADRQVVVEYRDAEGSRFALSGTNATQAASLTGDWYFSIFQPLVVATVDSSILVPLQPILLVPTQDFRIHLVSGQTGDQLSRIRYVWERFYTTGPAPGAGA